MSAKKGRSYEKKFEVAAPPEAVWKAITEGEELTRWFCLHATCESGVGGKHEIDWGGGAKGSHTIVIWKPNVHLRTESNRPELRSPAPANPASLMPRTGTSKVRAESRGCAWSPRASAKGRAGITNTTARFTAGICFTGRSSTIWNTIAASRPRM